MEGPAYRILMDDDRPQKLPGATQQKPPDTKASGD
jgi:nitrogen fixation-related uncharacterized protein